jgi:prevent-host-death family protein
MTIMQVTEFRTHLADVTNRVAYAGDRVCLERNGKPFVAVVSIEDMELLERLEDQMDLDLAKKAIKRNKFISAEALSKELGL